MDKYSFNNIFIPEVRLNFLTDQNPNVILVILIL